ncbi:MAG: UvrD-helicase domain-containing protein [Planctomycetota bacterium]
MPLDWMDVMAAAEAGGAGEAPEDPARVAELLADLNEPQRQAVLHGDGPLLILAGAGSGKTRVITRRVAHLVATGRARPQEILAITFTNKAAGEMRHRCEAYFPVAGLWIGTFHATCARLLRREIEITGKYTRDFSIYDTYERNQLLKESIKALGYDVSRFRPGALGAWISATKNMPFDGRRSVRAPNGFEGEVYEAVKKRYLAAMQAANALDFDDLLLVVLELFDGHPGLRDSYARRFRHVLVDEYQDTNHVQYRLTRHLASAHGNLTVCGDPDQSIYGWRGADIKNILDFERELGGERPVVVVKLEHNYRSARPILGAAQGLIRHNLARKEKELIATRESEHKVRVLECSDENDEARAIVEGVRAALVRGLSPERMAVFYRTNFMQRALERAFRLAGVPYQIVGGVEFYERREVRDLVSYLRLLVNPRDDAACARVINVPGRGLGDKSVEELQRVAAEQGLSLHALATAPEALELVKGKARKGLESFAKLLRELAPKAAGPAEEALEAVVSGTNYFAHLATGDDAEAAARVENVEELLAGAREYDQENPAGGLRGYLEDVALVSDVDGFEEQSPRVTLMTLHSSKGLEFPVVFIAGLEEGLLPHKLALDDDPEAGAEEERRLLYVGITRAMDELTLTHARLRLHFGETAWQTPSRFLAELPGEWLDTPSLLAEEESDGPVFVSEEEDSYCELTVGARVEHDHFGYGVVESTRGEGANLKVVVHFASAGARTLMAQYAKLRVVRR